MEPIQFSHLFNDFRKRKRSTFEEQSQNNTKEEEKRIVDFFSDITQIRTQNDDSEDGRMDVDNDSNFCELDSESNSEWLLDDDPSDSEFQNQEEEPKFNQRAKRVKTSKIFVPLGNLSEAISIFGKHHKDSTKKRCLSPNEFFGNYEPHKKRFKSTCTWDNESLQFTVTNKFLGPNNAKIVAMFEQFCSFDNEGNIGCSGINKLKKALDIHEYHSFQFYCLVFLLNCKSKFRITRTEWCNALFDLNIDNMNNLKMKLKEMEVHAFHDWKTYQVKNFFDYVFKYLKDSPRSKILNINIAAGALKCLMKGRSIFIDKFVEFVKSNFGYMNKDQFKIFYDFNKFIDQEFSNYSVFGCYPTMYDAFYEHCIECYRNGDEKMG